MDFNRILIILYIIMLYYLYILFILIIYSILYIVCILYNTQYIKYIYIYTVCFEDKETGDWITCFEVCLLIDLNQC